MQRSDDVVSPFTWLGADGDGFWVDLLSMVLGGSTWPEGSESAMGELAQDWADLAQGLADASGDLQSAAADLLAAWDAPAAETFDDLARTLLGSAESGLPGHVQNAAAVARQVGDFGVDLQYAKISVNIAVAVAAMAAVLAVVMAFAGGLSLATLGPIAATARQAVVTALEGLASAAGRRALVQDVGRAVDRAGRLALTHGAGHHPRHEVVEEVLEELVIDVGTQAWQVADGTRIDWDGLSTVTAGLAGGAGGAVGAGLVAPVFARVRATPRLTALAGLGADGGLAARTGNAALRHSGGLAATAGTNVLASPAGGIAASLVTGQGLPAMDGSTFLAAALGAAGRYGTVSPTHPAVLAAVTHPVQTLTQLHADALTGRSAQEALGRDAAGAGHPPAGQGVDPVAGGRAATTAVPAFTDTAAADRTTPASAAARPASTAPDRAASARGTPLPGPVAVERPSISAAGTTAEPSDDGSRPSGADAAGPSTADAAHGPGSGVPRIAAGLTAAAPTAADLPNGLDSTAALGAGAAAPAPSAAAVGQAETSETGRAPSWLDRPEGGLPADRIAGSVPAGTSSAVEVPATSGPDPARTAVGTTAVTEPEAWFRSPEAMDGGADPGPGAGRTSDVGSGQNQSGLEGAPAVSAGESPSPPMGPPTAEQELYEGSPRAIQRSAIEAVAGAQAWADLVIGQLDTVFDALEADGFPRPEAVGTENAVKTVWSAVRKIQPPVQGGSTVASAFWAMDDLVRFAVQTDPSRYGDSVLATLELLERYGWAAPVPRPGQPAHEDWRNSWAPGNRHFGLLVVLTHVETGQRVEVQFPTAKSWSVGKQTHDLYEVFRVRSNDAVDRVRALARIRDTAMVAESAGNFPSGVDKLGHRKLNGLVQVLGKESALAREFLALAAERYGSAVASLITAGVSPETARDVVSAAQRAASSSAGKKGSAHDGSTAPGMADMGTGAASAPGKLGALPEHRSGSGPHSDPLSASGAGPGHRTSERSGPIGSRKDRDGEGFRVQDRDLDEAVHPADPGDPLGGGRGAGSGLVQRAERDLDLRPEESLGDRAPGGRGPVRPAATGDPGTGRSGGPQEGDDAAHPETSPGDLPQPGRPGTGHVGHRGGPGAPPAAQLTGPLAVGADTASALRHVLAESSTWVLWAGYDGSLAGQAILLADGSSIRVSTGDNPWATPEPDRPLQMWTVGAVHLDDGPLTPAASAFLVDLSTALQEAEVGHPGPSSEWLSQRATLDPRTYEISERGVARPRDGGDDVRVWDAAQGWVDARRAGGLARVVDEGLVPAGDYASWSAEPLAGAVLEQAARVGAEVHRSRVVELNLDAAARAEQRNALRVRSAAWAATTVTPALALFLDSSVRAVASAGDRLLVELDNGRLAVVAVAAAENDALAGSRPGLQQAGSTADIGRLRNELAELAETQEQLGVVHALTHDLQEGAVRHFRVQGVLVDDGFVGTRVTEFEVVRPAPDVVGAVRAGVEPHRYVDPGLATREAMDRAVTGWTPTSVTEAIDSAHRWLPFVNPLHLAFPVTPGMPYANNCGDCSRAVADLVQGRDARTAYGDNGARVLDSWTRWGADPGELQEMWRWAGTVPGWHGRPASATSVRFTADANARIAEALSARPEGTVAIVLVNWSGEHGQTLGGHWFTAAVTERGVEWIDGQTAEHHAWPPLYARPYNGFSVLVRAQGSPTWIDLFPGSVDPPVAGPQVGAGTPGDVLRRPLDPTLATRIANATGDWPDEEFAPVAPQPWQQSAGTTPTAGVPESSRSAQAR